MSEEWADKAAFNAARPAKGVHGAAGGADEAEDEDKEGDEIGLSRDVVGGDEEEEDEANGEGGGGGSECSRKLDKRSILVW